MSASQNVIGKNVAGLRMAAGLTQEEFTARLNILGWDLSRATLGKIESGVRRVNDAEVFVFSEALKVNSSELFVTLQCEEAVEVVRQGNGQSD